MLLGVIADDMTGATDVALMLNRAGMRTLQVIGAPAKGAVLPEA
ncbi:four-carbon acid sugar kinase family protein, partial [Bosea sp. (in: a-proteobacteria)]